MNAFIFPGQGSQVRGMGKELFDVVPEFKAWEPKVDQQLGYSVRELCLNDKDSLLSQTQYTQPCLYTINALHYLKCMQELNYKPFLVAGHSLGEYNALWVAGAFDFLTGLRLVQKRGELMSQAKDGGMAALVGLSVESISGLLSEHALDDLEIANKNAPKQTVLSGAIDAIKNAEPLMKAAGVDLFMQLPVSAAFHSRYMYAARSAYDEFLNTIEFNTLNATVVSNVTGQPYPKGDANEVIRTFLSQQITRPVEWVKIVRYLLSQGVTDFHECGPGNVLTRLVRLISEEALVV